MKRYISLCLALLGVLFAYAESISVANVTIEPGQTGTVSINLTNEHTDLVSFQMDLTLPDGVSINKAGCSLSSRFTDEDQELTIGKQGDNVYRLTSTSFALTSISGTSGEIITLSLTAAADSEGGTATLSDIRFVTSNSERLTLDETSFNITIETSSPAITFADANVKALCVANWDTNQDGELSEDETAIVTDLGEVFMGNTDITSFNELQYFTGLTSIADYAFNGCNSLTSVTFPNSLTGIGNGAFAECIGLTSVTIPNGVTYIGSNPFQKCSGLIAISVEEGNVNYDSRNNCNAIIETETNKLISGCKNTIIPEGITTIGGWAFSFCTDLTSITIPDGVTGIQMAAFENCYALTSLNIPHGVTYIDGWAFSYCNNLPSVNIPNSVTSIGKLAFNNCHSLTSIVIPNSVTNLGEAVFQDCHNLTTVKVDIENPPTIDANAFSNRANATLYVPVGCKAAYEAADYWKEFGVIVEMAAPSPAITFADTNVKTLCVQNWDTNGDGELSEAEAATVTDLGTVFQYNTEITSFDELQYFTGLTEIADYAFNECKNLESVILPSEVTRIGHWAFLTCSNLNTIVIPASVIDIGAGAFAGCINMISITVDTENTVYDSREDCNAIIHSSTNTVVAGCKNMIIPEGVTSIGDWALNGMGSLTSVVLPSSLTSIGTGAFSWCWSLPSITIPANVTSIGSSSFEGCGNLTSVIVENPEPVAIEESTFSNRANATLTVPFPTKYLYEAADYWKEFKEIVQMDGPVAIGDTFPAPVPCDEATTDLTFKVTNVSPLEVEVSASPEDIAGAVTIPATVAYNGLQFAVKAIGERAFRERNGITSVTIEEGIESIYGWAFELCENNVSVTLPESVKRIAGAAFAYNTKLQTINLPEQLTDVEDWVFARSDALKSITLPEGLKSIRNNAFRESGLESIKFPSTLTELGSYAFNGCQSLGSINFNGISAVLHDFVFSNCSSLENLTIPSNVHLAEWNHFDGCTGLKTVVFEPVDETIDWWCAGSFANCINLESVTINGWNMLRGIDTFKNCGKLKTVTLTDGTWGNKHYAQNFQGVPDDILFMVPDGKAVDFLKRGYKNVSDKSGLPLVREEFETEAAHIMTIVDNLTDGDKTTLNNGINEARSVVNATDDYMVIYAQIAAIKTAAKFYISTATLPEDFDVTAATILNPDIDRFDIGWRQSIVNYGIVNYNAGAYTADGVTIDHFEEVHYGGATLTNGKIEQTINSLPAGIYRLEADIIATNQSDANAEVTGVNLFAGSTKTAVATENEKPQHFSVEFTQYEDADCTIGIDVANTNANWVAMDNVRLYRLGGEVPAAVVDANEAYYLQNVETGKFLNQGNSWGTHAVLKDEGLPLRITRLPDGSYTFYFLEGSAREHLLFRTGPSNVYVDYNSSDANQCPYWTITATDVEGIFHIQSLITDSRYGQQVYPGTYLGNNPTKEAVNHDGTPFGVYNDVDGDITDTEGMNLKWRFVKQDWFNIAVNSDMEGTDNVCFFSSENYPEDEEIAPSTIVEGAGVDGSRGIVIHSVDNPTNVYDSQFFFRLPQTLPAGTKYRISFDYKASQETSGRTETHAEPGKFSSLNCIGDINYSTDWKHFELIGTVSAEQSPADNPMRTIAFDLANTPTSTTYYFDNVVFEIDRNQITPLAIVAEAPTAKEVAYTGAAQELVNPGRALFGTMQYSLDGTNFSTTIPTGTDVGEYTVYYKVMGDEDHGDTEAATVIVTLAQPDNLLYADNVSVCRGSRVVLPISLKNDDAVNMVDFYLQLPEGMSIADGSDGNPDVSLVSGRSNKHVVTAQLKEAGRYHIVCYSSQNNAFNDNDGALFNITLACDEDVAVGSYEGTVMNILMSDTDRNSHVQPNFTFNIEVPDLQLGDVNNDGNINGLDIVEMVDHIMHRPSENFHFATADLHCDNKINGLDLVKLVKLVLDQDITQNASHAPAMRRNAPREGWLTLKDNGRGSLTMGVDSSDGFVLAQCVVEVSEDMQLKNITADGSHVVAWQPIDERRYAVVAYSAKNDMFGTNGSLLTFDCSGKGSLMVSCVMLVDSERNERHFASTGLDVVTGLDAVETEGKADAYDLQGRKMADDRLPKGVYIINGKKVVVR